MPTGLDVGGSADHGLTSCSHLGRAYLADAAAGPRGRGPVRAVTQARLGGAGRRRRRSGSCGWPGREGKVGRRFGWADLATVSGGGLESTRGGMDLSASARAGRTRAGGRGVALLAVAACAIILSACGSGDGSASASKAKLPGIKE